MKREKLEQMLGKKVEVTLVDKVKIVTEEVSEEKDGRRKRKKIRKATVVDVYEYFILLRIKTKIAGNSFCESLSWQEFEMMRR